MTTQSKRALVEVRWNGPIRIVTTYTVPGSIRHHLFKDCRHLKRARRVNRTDQPNLWPGFVCDTCRVETACRYCGSLWPYCGCGEDTP